MNEVTTFHRIVMLCGEKQLFKTNWALRSCNVLQTFMLFIRVWDTIAAFKAMSDRLRCASPAHLAMILSYSYLTQ